MCSHWDGAACVHVSPLRTCWMLHVQVTRRSIEIWQVTQRGLAGLMCWTGGRVVCHWHTIRLTAYKLDLGECFYCFPLGRTRITMTLQRQSVCNGGNKQSQSFVGEAEFSSVSHISDHLNRPLWLLFWSLLLQGMRSKMIFQLLNIKQCKLLRKLTQFKPTSV